MCAFGWIGYESGSSTQPITSTALACTSNGCPFAGEGTTIPVIATEQPAVTRAISLA